MPTEIIEKWKQIVSNQERIVSMFDALYGTNHELTRQSINTLSKMRETLGSMEGRQKMKVYAVYHLYEIDGGSGDAVASEICVEIFERESDAKAFVDKCHNPRVYRKPYDELYCGVLSIREMNIITHDEFNLDEIAKEFNNYMELCFKGGKGNV